MKSVTRFLPASTEIHGEIVAILSDGKLSPTQQRTQVADAVVLALVKRGQFFFHRERPDYQSSMFFDNQRKQLDRIRSDAFTAWLSGWLCVNRADSLFRFIIMQVETAALSSPHTKGIVPESFWAARQGAIYISNGDGQAVRVTPGSIDLVDNGTDGVLFAASRTLRPWTITDPVDPFEVCSLFSGANCAVEHGLDLLRLWLFSLPTTPASKPPLCLTGEVGSGKTRLAKGFAQFYGLPVIVNKVEDESEDDFWVNMDAGGLFTLDNADTGCKWLADAVASAATDGCSRKRKLYTDADTVTRRARAWLCITTANPTFASDAGLADRLLVDRLDRRTGETSDGKLSDEISTHRDSGLSFIVHTLAGALADKGCVPQGLNFRHPDFAAFAVRIGRAIKREAQAIRALKKAEQDKSAFCVENHFLWPALFSVIQSGGGFQGTAGDLLPKLKNIDPELQNTLSARRLGKHLGAMWTHLEKVLHATRKTGRGRTTIYTFSLQNGECGEFEPPI